MYIKSSASIEGCRTEILIAAITIIEPIFNEFHVGLVITSGAEKYKHKAKRSAHYRGDAIDLRSRELSEEQQIAVLGLLINDLGPNFVVLLESNHFHVEFSPVYEPT